MIKPQTALSLEERVANGKALRDATPLDSHAGWKPSKKRLDPIKILVAQNKTRIPSLVPIRFGRMLQSPFAFLRGAAAIMAADLAASPTSGIIVARTIPFVSTAACVNCVSCEFHPLLELSAERVSHGAMLCAVHFSAVIGKKIERIRHTRKSLMGPPGRRSQRDSEGGWITPGDADLNRRRWQRLRHSNSLLGSVSQA